MTGSFRLAFQFQRATNQLTGQQIHCMVGGHQNHAGNKVIESQRVRKLHWKNGPHRTDLTHDKSFPKRPQMSQEESREEEIHQNPGEDPG